jgi:hypothetical protein
MAQDTKSELDPVDACLKLIFFLGAAQAFLLQGDERAKETARAVWDLLPLAKAFGKLASSRRPELEQAWREALAEPLPFGGGPPMGVTDADLYELRTLAHGWTQVDELTVTVGADELGRKVLRVLDAVAILTGKKGKAEQLDAALRKAVRA